VKFNVKLIYSPVMPISFVSANPPPSVGNNVWNIGGLGAGGSGTILITVRVNGGATLNNVVTVGSAQTSLVTASATTTVIALPAFNLTKSDNPDPVLVGDNLVYNITYRNTGAGGSGSIAVTVRVNGGAPLVNQAHIGCDGGSHWHHRREQPGVHCLAHL